MKQKHLWFSEKRLASGALRREVTVEDRDDARPIGSSTLWYEIDATIPVPPTDTLNAFVCALVLQAMSQGRDIHAHGPVSLQLLANLEEFQAAYRTWFPNELSLITITAEQEIDRTPGSVLGRPALLAFSGGVDAAFSYFRHSRAYETRHPRKIGAVLLAHGFDVRLKATEGFAMVKRTAEALLKDEPVGHIWIRTNVREGGFVGTRSGSPNTSDRWMRSYGAALASCFHQFDGPFSEGMIASDEPYDRLVIPWGSTPITNGLLSSERMRICYDSGGYTRVQKIAGLAQWPQALDNLRVCYMNQRGINCCKCEKCLRTILNFRALKLPRPSCFPDDVSDNQIQAVSLTNRAQTNFIADILDHAARNGVRDSWTEAARHALERAEHRLRRQNTSSGG